MSMPSVSYAPIGVIRTQHHVLSAIPIQPVYAADCMGQVCLLPEYVPGLRDLKGFSHVYLLYYFHQAAPPQLAVTPFLQDEKRGVFATRSPQRPNPLGMSIVTLLRCDEGTLHFSGADMLDGTPLLDIKPYVERFDCVRETRSGWQEDVPESVVRDRARRGLNGGGQLC